MNPHSVVFFDLEASLDGASGVILWNPTDISAEGVKGLAQCLIEFRKFVHEKRATLGRAVTTLSAINDKNIPHLLSCAYRASFQTDEGRPIRALIAVPSEPAWTPPLDDPRFTFEKRVELVALRQRAIQAGADLLRKDENSRLHAYRFASPINLDNYKPLVKFAPLLPERDGAITVEEANSLLVVSGLALLDQRDSDRHTLRMPRLWHPSAAMLIEIVGPGHLRVSEGPASFTLYADQLVRHSSLFEVEPVRRWLAELSAEWVEEFKKHGAYDPVAELFGSQERFAGTPLADPNVDVWIALQRILREAISLGHGGAYAILPAPKDAPVRITRELIPVDLGKELQETWAAHCRVITTARQSPERLLDSIEEKRTTAHRWVRRLISIGRLSAADGCVVLDRRLVLHGFGGSIEKNPAGFELGNCQDVATGLDVPASELLKSFGERHRSAFALCRQVRNAIVFVISQDGDLRVFASDAEGHVLFASNLTV
jgi:hypothetical protein